MHRLAYRKSTGIEILESYKSRTQITEFTKSRR